jgi:hypothetical protein
MGTYDSDMTYSKGVDTGRYGSAVGVTNAVALVKQMRSRIMSINVVADTNANTNLAEIMIPGEFGNWVGGAMVTSARLIPSTNINTQNTTNYANVKLQWRDDTGVNVQTVGTVNFAGVNGVGFQGIPFTLTSNQLSMTALAKLTLRHDKYGAGFFLLPAYTVSVVVEDT